MTPVESRADHATFTRALIEDHRAHGGTITFGPFKDRPILLLHTVGARTGEPRIAPLVFSREGDRYVVMASKGGAPSNPSWFANLVANPIVVVEAEGETFTARAEVPGGVRRDLLWAQHVAQHPGFAEYQRKTSRVIPAVTLTRIG